MASRTDAVDAYLDEERCIQSSIGSDLESVTKVHSQDVATVLDQLKTGAISEDDARQQLQELSTTREQLAGQALRCTVARLEIKDKARVDEMDRYRNEHEGDFLGWTQKMQRDVEQCSSRIGALREDDKFLGRRRPRSPSSRF